MTDLLSGKTVVVSGVGTGLGREIALAASRDGANVVLGARTEANLKAVADEIDPSGQRVCYAVTDILDSDACRALIATAAEKFGGVDALINVAAKEDVFGGLAGADLEDWRKMLDANVIGTLQLTQAALGELERNGGAVVFIGTQSSFHPRLPQSAYATSKGALQAAMFNLAKEFGPKKIRFNMVVPTWMWGPNVELYVQLTAKQRKIPEDEVKAQITKHMPLGEIPEDGDVANAAVFFISDRARMLTGQTLFVNAGEYFR
ncbi:SDR family oxidoreductase [Skermania sp. ID1734]|uniref:SDR family oxidoreductase n=1 Tax=Skermania sp. ID1734 TaxID=2597516 RepID=UPI00117D9CCF|nr:SDR family oxidoreductase [Skermania sp. ID1734]TSD99729.1 SDR family oxidoreductase [Skermania sp. ID1734]